MPTFKSNQVTKIDSPDFDMLKPNEAHGRVRAAYFDFATPVGVAQNDIVEAVEVPIGARVIGGTITHGALGTNVTIAVGYAGAATRYKAATASASAGAFSIAGTIAENYGDELSQRQRLILTLGGGTPSAGILIEGHVLYVVD